MTEIDWTTIIRDVVNIIGATVAMYAAYRWKKQDKCERKHAEEAKEVEEIIEKS